MFARTPEQRWLCLCSKDNDLREVSCVNCGTDRRGLGLGDFKPEPASATLSQQLAFLRIIFADG